MKPKPAIVVLAALLAATFLPASGTGAPHKRQVRVGFVADVGLTPNRRNVIALLYLGFLHAVKRLGVQGRVVRVAPNQDATGALSFLARQKYDLIVMGYPDRLPAGTVEGEHELPAQALPQRMLAR